MHPDDRPQLFAEGFLYSLAISNQYPTGVGSRNSIPLLPIPYSLLSSLSVPKRGHYRMLLYDDHMRQPTKDITYKRVILFTKHSKCWQVVRPDPKSKNVKV